MLYIFSYGSLLACDCKSISKAMDYENSFVIFLGEIKAVDSERFVIMPLEFFKGEEFDLAISIFDECSITPAIGERWLVYATKYSETEIFISSCGSSRSFNWPFSPNSEFYPRPPRIIFDSTSSEIISRLDRGIALNELYFDINTLRSTRMRRESETPKAYDELSENQNALSILLGVILVGLMIVSIILNLRRGTKN